MALTYAWYWAPRKAQANNEKLKSARNEHNNESFYMYENCDKAVKYSAPVFLSLCRIYAIIAIKKDFVIH